MEKEIYILNCALTEIFKDDNRERDSGVYLFLYLIYLLRNNFRIKLESNKNTNSLWQFTEAGFIIHNKLPQLFSVAVFPYHLELL